MHQHEKSGLQATGSINLITERKGILVTARADQAIASQQCEATLHAALQSKQKHRLLRFPPVYYQHSNETGRLWQPGRRLMTWKLVQNTLAHLYNFISIHFNNHFNTFRCMFHKRSAYVWLLNLEQPHGADWPLKLEQVMLLIGRWIWNK